MAPQHPRKGYSKALTHFLTQNTISYEQMIVDYENLHEWAWKTVYPNFGPLPSPNTTKDHPLPYNLVSQAMIKDGNRTGFCQARFVELVRSKVDPDEALQLIGFEMKKHKWNEPGVLGTYLNFVHRHWSVILISAVLILSICIASWMGLQYPTSYTTSHQQSSFNRVTNSPTKPTTTLTEHHSLIPIPTFSTPEEELAYRDYAKTLLDELTTNMISLNSISTSSLYKIAIGLSITKNYLSPSSKTGRKITNIAKATTDIDWLIFSSLEQLLEFVSDIENEPKRTITSKKKQEMRQKTISDLNDLRYNFSYILGNVVSSFFSRYHDFLQSYPSKSTEALAAFDSIIYTIHSPVEDIRSLVVSTSKIIDDLTKVPGFKIERKDIKGWKAQIQKSIQHTKKRTGDFDGAIDLARIACTKDGKKDVEVVKCLLDFIKPGLLERK